MQCHLLSQCQYKSITFVLKCFPHTIIRIIDINYKPDDDEDNFSNDKCDEMFRLKFSQTKDLYEIRYYFYSVSKYRKF